LGIGLKLLPRYASLLLVEKFRAVSNSIANGERHCVHLYRIPL
jgi:hypothetical protein